METSRNAKTEISLLQQPLHRLLVFYKSLAVGTIPKMFFQGCTLHHVEFIIDVSAQKFLTVPTQHCGPPCAKSFLFLSPYPDIAVCAHAPAKASTSPCPAALR